MDAQKKFIKRVNDSVVQKIMADGQEHRGEKLHVIIPVPKELLIDCTDTTGINLDNIKVFISENQEIRDESGSVIVSVEEMGAILYAVTGTIK